MQALHFRLLGLKFERDDYTSTILDETRKRYTKICQDFRTLRENYVSATICGLNNTPSLISYQRIIISISFEIPQYLFFSALVSI